MSPRDISSNKQTQFYFFSGKGGVGKTTVSAATALWFSKQGKKTLVISIDPAHSLSDSFEKKIGGEVKQLGKGLYGLEIDPAKAMQEYKEKFMPKIENSFLGSMGLEDTFDIAGMTPGMDEIAAFDKFLKYMNSDEYDIIIFDTAPTGHALRFLSLPDVLDSWIGKMIKIRMQFAGIAGLVGKLLPFGSKGEQPEKLGAEQLEGMKQRIKAAKEILSNPKRTHFNLVLIPEEMSIFESERSLKALADFNIPVEGVVVNNMVPDSMHCKFCAARREMQAARLKTIGQVFRKYRISKLQLFPKEVKGIAMLEKVASLLYGK
jgi:arsenite/tail-anchored protein-transporting ATPase